MSLTPGGRIDEDLPRKPVRLAVLTISDTRDEESDTSGHLLADRVRDAGHELAGKTLVRDDIEAIRGQVRAWIGSGEVDAIVTTVKKGGAVSIPGFGSFKQHARAARNGVNPSTGAKIKIAAAKLPKFAPGAGFKAAVDPKAAAKKAAAKPAAKPAATAKKK